MAMAKLHPEFRLGDLCAIQSGGTPSRSERSYWGKGIPWAKISDIEATQGDLKETEEQITTDGLRAIRGRLFPKGTVLFAIYGSVGKLAVAGQELSANQAILGIQIHDQRKLSPRYLVSWLRSQQRRFESEANGVAQRNLSAGYVRDLMIPVPGIDEQHHITDIIDQADALRHKQLKADQLADDLVQSLFLDMFGHPVKNPKGWSTGTLRDLIEDIEAGWSANGEDRPIGDNEMGVLRVSAVTSGIYKPEEVKVVSDLQRRKLIIPNKGDLLFSRANTKDLIAATCLVHEEDPRVFLPDKLWRLIPRDGRATAAFLKYLISFPRFRWTIACKATGTSGSMLNISQDKVLETPCIIPPYNLMKQFHLAVFQIADVRIKQNKAIGYGQDVFAALSREYFG